MCQQTVSKSYCTECSLVLCRHTDTAPCDIAHQYVKGHCPNWQEEIVPCPVSGECPRCKAREEALRVQERVAARQAQMAKDKI